MKEEFIKPKELPNLEETQLSKLEREGMEKYLESKLGEHYDRMVKLYIEQKCSDDPKYFSSINESLFNGICNKINKELSHSSEMEKGFISCLELIPEQKVKSLKKSNKYINYARIVLESLDKVKHWGVESYKIKFNREA